MWLLLILYVSTALAQSNTCGTSELLLTWWESIGIWYVSYDSSPCDTRTYYRPFCNGSGWDNEEATVACREEGFIFGLGRYVLVESFRGTYGHIECDGTENSLAECDVGPVSFEAECRFVAVVTQCSNAPPVYVIGLAHNELFPYHLTAEENQQSVQVCLEVVGAETLSQTVHITLTTTPNTHGIFTPATAFSDYLPLNKTLTFEPSINMTLEGCVEIDILDDSRSESWEVFSVQISTNTSAVELLNTLIDVYITPNDMTSSRIPSSTQEPAESASVTNTITTKIAVTTEKIAISTLHHTSSVRTISFGFRVASSAVQPTPIPTPTSLRTTSDTGDHASSIARSTKAPIIIKTPVSTTARPSITNPQTNSDRLVVGVTVTAVVVVLLTAALMLVFILWLRIKTKRLAGNQSEPPQLSLEVATETEENKRLSLTNPTYQPYQPSAFQSQEEKSETPEHNFTNPLYTPVEGGGPGGSSAPPRPVNADYEYVETGFTNI